MEINDGFLILDKNKNCTSHDCVKSIRKILNIKKVGHTGTLDPQVTGVLPIAIGSATRFIQYLPQEKRYLGIIKLGIRTHTDDIHGEVLSKKPIPKISYYELDHNLNFFRGNFKQIPPKVSSVHINGVRAYQKSWRKEDFVLPSKEVRVDKLILKEWVQEEGKLSIEITCSSGTYIRSIARDLGLLLKSEGCLYYLRRIEASGFKEDKSVDLNKLISEKNNINEIISPITHALNHLSRIILKSDKDILYWQTGRKIAMESENLIINQKYLVLDQKNTLLGIGINHCEEINYLQPKLVLNAK